MLYIWIKCFIEKYIVVLDKMYRCFILRCLNRTLQKEKGTRERKKIAAEIADLLTISARFPLYTALIVIKRDDSFSKMTRPIINSTPIFTHSKNLRFPDTSIAC